MKQHLVKAAEDIINGASFDYNLPCIAEKSLIVVESVAERLVQQMQTFGALLLSPADTDKLRAVCLPEGQANKNWSARAHRPCWKPPGSLSLQKRRVC